MSAPESDRQATTGQAGSAGRDAIRFCGHCGTAIEAGRAFCPACGAPVAATTPVDTMIAASADFAPSGAETTPAWTAAEHSPDAPPPPAAAPPPPPLPLSYLLAGQGADAPTLTAAPPPPPPSGWDENQFERTRPTGMAQAAYTPIVAGGARRKPRHRVLAVVSTLLLLAVLATTGFWLYGVFAAHQETAAARFVPANTILFAGIDTVQAVKNGHHVSSSDLGNGTGQGDVLKQATGLDWNNDILPWLGRDIAFAVFPHATTSSSPGGFQYPPIGYVYLLQSRDDGAAQAAMKKAASFQTQQGNTINTSSYGGFTLYSVTPSYSLQSGTTVSISGSASAPPSGPGAPPVASSTSLAGPITGTTVTAGKGWALVASDSASAQAVIDRINAGGNGLDTTATFQAATRDLPADRFGTFFLNLRAYTTAFSMPPGASQPDIPFIDAYPAAGGYAEWTNTGVRGVIELPGQRPASVPDLSGDTTGLAQMIPAGALAYSGAANFGAAYQAVESLTPAPTTGAAPADTFAQYFGQPASNPVFQQPAAFAVLRQPGAAQPGQVTGLVGLIRAPDAAAATAALTTAAKTQHWTLKPTTVAGISATAIYADVLQPVYSVPPTPPGSPPTPPPAPTSVTELVGVAAQVHGTFIVAGSTDDLAAVLKVASGAAPSLGSSAAFQQLVAAAPSGAMSTTYVNLAALLSHTPPVGSGSNVLQRATSMLVTSVWSQSKIAMTADIQLQG
ncbi:MAG TPA: DUF3352 domain-containing protein [Ktedonobacterales bacterium]